MNFTLASRPTSNSDGELGGHYVMTRALINLELRLQDSVCLSAFLATNHFDPPRKTLSILSRKHTEFSEDFQHSFCVPEARPEELWSLRTLHCRGKFSKSIQEYTRSCLHETGLCSFCFVALHRQHRHPLISAVRGAETDSKYRADEVVR